MVYGQYKIHRVLPDTYAIVDYGFWKTPVMLYLLLGTEKALLIDSGYGGLDLPEIIGKITDKEVLCACTHGHIDHALGAHWFRTAYLHSADAQVYQQHCAKAFIERCASQGVGLPVPKAIVSRAGYIKNAGRIAGQKRTPLIPLEEVKAFDLGGRKITWRLLPGHTRGSVVFYDEKHSAVFEGDAAPNGLWLFLPESLPLAAYRDNLNEYLFWLQDRKAAKRFTGHSSPKNPKSPEDISALISVCDRVVSGKLKGLPVSLSCGYRMPAHFAWMKGTFLFYNPENIHS